MRTPRHSTPFERMRQLHDEGAAFWLEFPSETPFGAAGMQIDVLSFGLEWVELAVRDEKRQQSATGLYPLALWVRWADLGPFETVEG